MTYQSPRIYTYKITFEEVPYYYYGVHKEKKYNEYYMGSPITNKWCWELYTPKKQILQLFDFTDEGWLEAQEVEKKLIRPFYNTDKWCLNESCGYKTSIKICSQNGKKNSIKNKKNKVGIFSWTKNEWVENSKKAGKISYEKQKELGIGIFAVPIEKRREYGLELVKRGVGVHSLTKEELSEAGKKGAAKNKENKVGIFSLTKEQLSENGKKSNSQNWMCLETGYITTSAGLTHYQKARGIDTSKRVRVV
jgi:hypothetical protein